MIKKNELYLQVMFPKIHYFLPLYNSTQYTYT